MEEQVGERQEALWPRMLSLSREIRYAIQSRIGWVSASAAIKEPYTCPPTVATCGLEHVAGSTTFTPLLTTGRMLRAASL